MAPGRVVAGLAAALMLAAGLALLVGVEDASAQPPPTEAQAVEVERQLLCPTCTNERLDVCPLEICKDMRRIIRERLQAGSSPDDILLYFRGRYGEKVLADVPAEGFNLWLYGWIVGSVAAVGGLGAWFLASMRRRPRRAGTQATPADDRWLDEQLAEGAPD